MKIKIIHISLILAIFSCKDSPNNKEKITISENQTLELDTESISSDLNNFKIENTGVNEFWKNAQIHSAKVFAYEPHILDDRINYKSSNIVNKNNKIHPKIVSSLTTELTKEQINYIQELIYNETNFSEGIASCFDPHHGIVFYDRKDRIIGHLSICFQCNNYRLYPERLRHIPVATLKSFILSIGMPMYSYKTWNP